MLSKQVFNQLSTYRYNLMMRHSFQLEFLLNDTL